jgi:hypothetical protein
VSLRFASDGLRDLGHADVRKIQEQARGFSWNEITTPKLKHLTQRDAFQFCAHTFCRWRRDGRLTLNCAIAKKGHANRRVQ